MAEDGMQVCGSVGVCVWGVNTAGTSGNMLRQGRCHSLDALPMPCFFKNAPLSSLPTCPITFSTLACTGAAVEAGNGGTLLPRGRQV